MSKLTSKSKSKWRFLLLVGALWLVITAAKFYSRQDGVYEVNGTWSSTSHAGASSGTNPGCSIAGSNKIYIADTVTTSCATLEWKGSNEIFIEDGGVLIINGDFVVKGSAHVETDENSVIIVNGDMEVSSSAEISLDGYLYVSGDVTVSGSGDVCGDGTAEVGGNVSGSGWCFAVTTLPIELLSFKANMVTNGDVLLEWSTASEQQNDYFLVERSANGLSFEEITQVRGAGNSTSRIDYDYTDAYLNPGTYYYRLTQVDYNGDYETFEIISVTINLDEQSGECELVVMPNPCVPSCRALLNNCPEGQYQTDILDGYGNMISQLIPISSDGRNAEYHISKTNYMMPGVYVLRASNGTKQVTKKVMMK